MTVEPEKLICPFNNAVCLQERCALKVKLLKSTPSVLGVMGQPTADFCCVFTAALEVNSFLLNRIISLLMAGLEGNRPTLGG